MMQRGFGRANKQTGAGRMERTIMSTDQLRPPSVFYLDGMPIKNSISPQTTVEPTPDFVIDSNRNYIKPHRFGTMIEILGIPVFRGIGIVNQKAASEVYFKLRKFEMVKN